MKISCRNIQLDVQIILSVLSGKMIDFVAPKLPEAILNIKRLKILVDYEQLRSDLFDIINEGKNVDGQPHKDFLNNNGHLCKVFPMKLELDDKRKISLYHVASANVKNQIDCWESKIDEKLPALPKKDRIRLEEASKRRGVPVEGLMYSDFHRLKMEVYTREITAQVSSRTMEWHRFKAIIVLKSGIKYLYSAKTLCGYTVENKSKFVHSERKHVTCKRCVGINKVRRDV